MSEHPPKNFHLVSDAGHEGQVIGYDQAGVQGGVVIKQLEKRFRDGLPKVVAEQIRERYQKLRTEFGDLIPKQKVMPKQHGQHYFITQERLALTEPADVLEYSTDQLPAAARTELETVIEKLKQGYAAYRQQEDEFQSAEHPCLDLGSGNLLVTQDGHLRYADIGSRITDYAGLYGMDVLVYEVECRLARLELVAGRPPREVFDDAFYREVMEQAEELDPAALQGAIDDPVAFGRILDQVFNKSPLRHTI